MRSPAQVRLYEASYEAHFARARELAYHGLGWADAEATLLAAVLGSGVCRALGSVFLRSNRIGDAGAKVLAAAIGDAAALPCLRRFNLARNAIGEAGSAALRAAAAAAPERPVVLILTDSEAREQPDQKFV